jgi:hypothetical protein
VEGEEVKNDSAESEDATERFFEDMHSADMFLDTYLGHIGLSIEGDKDVLATTIRIAELIQRERLETRRVEAIEDLAKSLAVLSLRDSLPSGPSPLEAIAMALGYND